MAKCILKDGIESISGRIGNVEFRTFKKPNGKVETRAYRLPLKKNGSYGYERKTPVSAKEEAARKRFTLAAEYFKNLSDEQKKLYCMEFSRNKYTFNGKKYSTVRGYVIARFYAGELFVV